MRLVRAKQGRKTVATQLQPTPVLKGQDARNVIREVESKPTANQLKLVEERKNFFSNIGKRGLR